MATIGTFTKSENGFSGQIKTVTLNVKAKFAPAEKDNEKAPDYRIFAGQTELGAAWKKTSNAGREYLSVKLDDQLSRRRSSPRWSPSKAVTATPSSGPAAAPTDPQQLGRSTLTGGALFCVGASLTVAGAYFFRDLRFGDFALSRNASSSGVTSSTGVTSSAVAI